MLTILDLDGVIWLAEEPVDGSREAVARLRAAGHRVLFLTNNSSPTVTEVVAKLSQFGLEAAPEEVVTSAQAAASLVEPGATALVCGGPGVVEALEARAVRTVREGAADAVVVGFHRNFDYARLTAAFKAVIGGARLIGTNDDATYPRPDGPVPGGGAILAAVATASGVTPTVAGKPHQAMADLVRSRLVELTGDAEADVAGAVLLGDRPSTDGLMAKRLGVRFVHVLGGVTEDASAAGDLVIDETTPDLATFVTKELGQESA